MRAASSPDILPTSQLPPPPLHGQPLRAGQRSQRWRAERRLPRSRRAHAHAHGLSDDSSSFSRWFPSLTLYAFLVFACVAVLLFWGLSSQVPFLRSLKPSAGSWCGGGAVAAYEPAVPDYSSPMRFCMLVRAYRLNFHYVPTLMALLRHNTHPPNVFFIASDANSSLAELRRWVDRGNREAGFRFGHTLNVSKETAKLDFPDLDTVKEYGYAYTDAALNILTESAEYREQCHWMLISNADNIYGSYFLDRVEVEMAKGYQLIGFNMISHYDWVTLRGTPRDTREGSSDDGTRRYLDIVWQEGFIDLGAAVWNLSLWREMRLNFVQLGLATPKKLIEVSDGQFFEKLAKAGVSRIAIRQVLFMHQ